MGINNSDFLAVKPVLSAILDRLIPAIDDLPSAGQMELEEEIFRLVVQQKRFYDQFTGALGSFSDANPTFGNDDSELQDQALKSFETARPEAFGVIRDISYIAYYKNPSVHQRLGWNSISPQPEGNVMAPWDESVLENIRRREPFWRKV
jgi:hypothetical protein